MRPNVIIPVAIVRARTDGVNKMPMNWLDIESCWTAVHGTVSSDCGLQQLQTAKQIYGLTGDAPLPLRSTIDGQRHWTRFEVGGGKIGSLSPISGQERPPELHTTVRRHSPDRTVIAKNLRVLKAGF
jgi:hypothetical protein